MEKCPTHPRYKGKRRPKADCLDCWRTWISATVKEDPEAVVLVKDFEIILELWMKRIEEQKNG